jgi:hypothetical protein
MGGRSGSGFVNPSLMIKLVQSSPSRNFIDSSKIVAVVVPDPSSMITEMQYLSLVLG